MLPVVVTVFIVSASTLEATPPPVRYLTVKVVLAGAIPYVSVCRKFEGSKAVVNFICSNGSPNPTLSLFGSISSSTSAVVPEPNCICRLLSDLNRVVNLLETFSNLSR